MFIRLPSAARREDGLDGDSQRPRHPGKPARWRKQKYFAQHSGQNWSFFGETWSDDGQPSKIWLLRASSTPIKRHTKIQGDANPYDPAYETYFERREEAHMRESFRGTRILRFLWYEQRGLCPACNIKITRVSGCACITASLARWVVQPAQLTVSFFIPSAMTWFIAYVFLSPNRVSFQEAFEALSHCHVRFLEGRASEMGSGYSILFKSDKAPEGVTTDGPSVS